MTRKKRAIFRVVLFIISIVATIPFCLFIFLAGVWPVDDEIAMGMSDVDWVNSAVSLTVYGSALGVIVGLGLFTFYWLLSKVLIKQSMKQTVLWFSLVPSAIIIITSIVAGIIQYKEKLYI